MQLSYAYFPPTCSTAYAAIFHESRHTVRMRNLVKLHKTASTAARRNANKRIYI